MKAPQTARILFLSFAIVSTSSAITVALFSRTSPDGNAWLPVLIINLLINAIYASTIAFIATKRGLSQNFIIRSNVFLAVTLFILGNFRIILLVLDVDPHGIAIAHPYVNLVLSSGLTLYLTYGAFIVLALLAGCVSKTDD